MSLFPAYSSTSSASVPKNIDIKSEKVVQNSGNSQTNYDWLSLNSFNDQKVVELNNEIIVDKSEDKRKKSANEKRGHKKSSDHRRSDRKRHESKSSSSKPLLKTSLKTSRHSESTLAQFLSNKTFIEETGLSPENAYRFDKNRDKNNFAFNSLYYKNVANYQKHKTINISKRKREKTDDLGPKTKKKRYFSHENRFLLSKSRDDLIDFSKPEMKPMKQSLDFIPITSNQAFSHLSFDSKNSSSNPLGVYDQKTALWSEGKDSIDEIPVLKTKIQFQSMKDESNKNEFIGPNRAPTHEQHIYEKTQEFNAYLRDNETDIQKWLNFIAFQDKCVEPIDTTKDKIDGKTIENVVSEKKLAICEKALTFNPKSIDLLLCRLEILSHIWDFDTIMKEWKQLAFLYPNSMELWRKYIAFSHQNITHFNSSKTLKIYEKCVQILSKMLEKTFKSHSPPENLELELVLIIASYSQFLRSIGQTERAVSTFQALIEFNLFTPSLLTYDMSVQDWITLFEPFWDTGCARFGEDKAIGWTQVMQQKNVINSQQNSSQTQTFVDSEENKIVSEKCDKNIVWLKFELLRHRFHWLPARETHGHEVDDPERVVSSDDITDMLVRLREPISKYRLIVEFLRFLGVPNEECINYDNYFETSIEIPNFSIELPLFPPFFEQKNIIQNIFKTSVSLFSGELKSNLVLNWIKYEKNKTSDKMSAKQMRKFFKEFLKDESFRNDLSVWSEFASFEYNLSNNRSEGRKVFGTAIELMLNSKQNTEKLFKFVQNYVELELNITSLAEMSENLTKSLPNDSNSDKLCLNSLLSLTLNQMVSNPTPTLVLKGINTLKQYSVLTINQLFCLVFINYLTKGISHSKQVIEEHLSTKRSTLFEIQLFSLYLKLLLLNVRQNSGQSLRPLRLILDRALQSHPTEPQFLSLFINLEFKSNVFCRMRRFFTKTYNSILNQKSFSDNWNLILFAIHSELRRLDSINDTFTGYDTNSGIVNRVRVLFERAVTSELLSNCVTLWRLYLKFEINCKNISKAKSVFYRGLQNCSFSKILYMDGIQYFPQKLQEFLDIMTEKELRIRTPLEEIDLLVNNLE